ncbi:hypothetical protein SN11_11335 [Vibrio harveyi]|nr:hypothetical protein SN11_11335 [Vibrio harveyi]
MAIFKLQNFLIFTRAINKGKSTKLKFSIMTTGYHPVVNGIHLNKSIYKAKVHSTIKVKNVGITSADTET